MSEEKPWPDTIRAGDCEQHEPLVRRVLAPNPSPYTFTGTQTWIVGAGSDVAVIDPGPTGSGMSIGDPADANGVGHVEAILRATEGQRIAAILCTHTHRDHSPAAAPLKAATGAPIIGCAPLALRDDGPRADSAFDPDYAPDRVLADGERISGDGWTLEAVATPGHTSNHLCFALIESGALFTGDHVMAWSTSVVSPPDGDMAAYMASLAKLYDRDDRIYYPAHGPAVAKPRQLVRGMLGHRRQRERQILRELEKGAAVIPVMVSHMYKGLDPRLTGAAGRSVLAHLLDLQTRGIVRAHDEEWELACMFWTLLIAATAGNAVPDTAADPAIVALVAGEGDAQCLPDRSLCIELSGGDHDGAHELRVSSPASGDPEKVSLPLPYGSDGRALSLWPHLIPVPRSSEDGTPLPPEHLVGVIEEVRTMYSGGGGSGGRLHLLRFGTAPHAIALGDEVLDVVWDSSLLIRACFSEKDMEDRLGACHDDYGFKATLTVAPNGGGELPTLTYRSFATAYPQTSRRTEDNSGQKLKKSDLTQWTDPECSYSRTLRYNPATSRYEMDRAAPDCSSYTTP